MMSWREDRIQKTVFRRQKTAFRFSSVFCLLSSVYSSYCLLPPTFASPPVTQPATRPTEQQIDQWLAGLADVDPAIRAKSDYELMGLTRSDLPLLVQVIERRRPLHPSQAMALRDIVTHVYLTEEPYESSPSGFLGIRMPEDLEGDSKFQVLIKNRMPGFGGFRALRDGDVVLAIEQVPGEMPAPAAEPIDHATFTTAIKQMKPGQTVRLKVLRQGQVVRVNVKLDPRPPVNTMIEIDELILGRARAADAYWRRHFAPLMQGPLK